MGKGDNYRPVDKEKFDANFERVFGKRQIKTWNPDEDEEVAGDTGADRPDGGPAPGVSQESD